MSLVLGCACIAEWGFGADEKVGVPFCSGIERLMLNGMKVYCTRGGVLSSHCGLTGACLGQSGGACMVRVLYHIYCWTLQKLPALA